MVKKEGDLTHSVTLPQKLVALRDYYCNSRNKLDASCETMHACPMYVPDRGNRRQKRRGSGDDDEQKINRPCVATLPRATELL